VLERPLNADMPRCGRPRGRGKTYRVGLDLKLCAELECAAAARGLKPEVLLNAIGRVVVGENLITAVLDDMPSDTAG
jgi:hypothetical protein